MGAEMVIDWSLFITIAAAVVAAKVVFAFLSSVYSAFDGERGWGTNMDNLRADNLHLMLGVIRDEIRDVKAVVSEINTRVVNLEP